LPLPTPEGVLGITNYSGYPDIFWVKDNNPNVTGYSIYLSTDGVTYNFYVSFLKSAYPTSLCGVYDPPAGTTFNRYYYVTSTGTQPESPPSPIIHAVSGIYTQNLTIQVNCCTPTFIIASGSVPGSIQRGYFVHDLSYNNFWAWGDKGSGVSSVNYGYSGTGLTYLPSASLSSGVTYVADIYSFNNENWAIDQSFTGFKLP